MSVLAVDSGPFWLRLGASGEDGAVTRLHHEFPGRRAPHLGALYRAKVHTKDSRLGGVFCALGTHGTQGFLPTKGKPPAIGETLLVGIRREAIGAKACQLVPAPALRVPGATVRAKAEGLEVSPGPAGAGAADRALALAEAAFAPGEPGPVNAVPGVLRAITGLLSRETSEVRVTDPEVGALLRPWLEPLGIGVAAYDPAPLREVLDEAEEAALARIAALPGDGRVVFDETEALTAIDVDTGGRDARSAKGAQEAVAAALLSVIGRQASLRSLGGQIVLDLPRRAFASPKVLRDRLTKALRPIGRVSIPAVTNEGVVVVIAPREGPSLLERLTEPHGEGVRPARRLRADALAMRATRELEAALARDRAGRFTLSCPPRAAPYVEDASAALEARYGARFDVHPTEGPPHVRPQTVR